MIGCMRSFALFAALLYVHTLSAQTVSPVQTTAPPPARHIALIEGTGELLQFGHDIDKVAIAEPKIADAVVISAREVMVNGKGPGQTTLVVWEGGNIPARYDIRVARDTADADALRSRNAASLKAALPESSVEFSGDNESLVLTGR